MATGVHSKFSSGSGRCGSRGDDLRAREQLLYPRVLCSWDAEGALPLLRPPLLQVRKGNRTQTFYTMPEYEAWRESLANSRDASGWDVKYYKGELVMFRLPVHLLWPERRHLRLCRGLLHQLLPYQLH